MKEVYSIFSVSDYKGGELHESLNLSRDAMLTQVMEYGFYGDDLFSCETEYDLREAIKEGDQTNIYAGGDGIVMSIYVHKDNKIRTFNPSNLEDEIVDLWLRYNLRK